MSKSTSLVVYFGLSKGDGDWPSPDDLTDEEKQDPKSYSTFYLDLDGGDGSISPSVIKSCKVIYDGITPIPEFIDDSDEPYGIVAEDGEDCIHGKIRPIIQFELGEAVNPDQFLLLVRESYYAISPKSADPDDPFLAEDWNGVSKILNDELLEYWVEHLQENNAYSGKIFPPSELVDGVSAMRFS